MRPALPVQYQGQRAYVQHQNAPPVSQNSQPRLYTQTQARTQGVPGFSSQGLQVPQQYQNANAQRPVSSVQNHTGQPQINHVNQNGLVIQQPVLQQRPLITTQGVNGQHQISQQKQPVYNSVQNGTNYSQVANTQQTMDEATRKRKADELQASSSLS